MTAKPNAISLSQRISHLRSQTTGRIRAMAVPEVAIGALIVVFWSAAATVGALPLPLILLAVIVGLALHLYAVDSGNFIVLGAATAFVLLLIIGSARTLLTSADPLVYALAGTSALAHNESVRVSYARRRNAVVDTGSRIGSATGIGLVALVSVIAIGISGPLAASIDDRSWLWMPIAAAAVGLVIAGFAVIPTLGAPEARKERWQPGDQLPPARFDAEPGTRPSPEAIDGP